MTSLRYLAAPLVAVAILSACGKGDGVDETPDGNDVSAARAAVADTGNPLGATPTAGGMVTITPGDAKAVRLASEYKLTEENFTRFVTATDSLAALRKRDPRVDAFLSVQANDNGASGTAAEDNNAGRVRLENHPEVARVITSTGMSVKDYFVASVAIAQAERYMGNPKAAPANPVTGPNAEFLNAHKAHLDHLRAYGTKQ